MDHTTNIVPSYPEAFPPLDSCTPITSQHNHSAPPICDDISSSTTTTTATILDPVFQIQYDTPLYTEINIPLPRLPPPRNPARKTGNITSPPPSPSTAAATAAAAQDAPPRGRSKTLSSLSCFRTRHSSSTSSSQTPPSPSISSSATQRQSDDTPRTRPRKETIKSREINALMDLRHQSKKGPSGTIDALAVVPAVLVLSAELFTPGEKGGKRKDSGVGRWEDGIR
ncbi:hypothetical protein BM1_09422 [Bipolaris maydis]|nr:hypothetical protein BM1_09422 [Bipolaris maydis]